MTRAPRARLRWALVVAVLVLLADQATKWWAVNTLDRRVIDVVGSLRFRLVTNTGAAFSQGEGLGPWIGVLALATVVALLWSGRRLTTRLSATGLGLVLGGALGNLVDRAVRDGDGFLGGAVVDFIDLQWWPVFNVADSGVVIGALLLLVFGPSGESADGDADEDALEEGEDESDDAGSAEPVRPAPAPVTDGETPVVGMVHGLKELESDDVWEHAETVDDLFEDLRAEDTSPDPDR